MVHPARLGLLCCLLDGGPLGASQLTARTDESAPAVRYWIRLLESFNLVEKLGDLDGVEPLYIVTLDEHPDWVRETVEEHRRRQEEAGGETRPPG